MSGWGSAWRWVALALVTAVLFAAPTSASASSRANVVATQALGRAADAIVRAATPDVAKGLAAVKSYAHRLVHECPAVVAGSPENYDSEQLSDELVGAMTVTGYHVAAAPIAVFARTVGRLHWSNGQLTEAVGTLATKLQGLSTLAVPNVCGNIRTWVAGGYTTLPASTVQFDQRYAAVDLEAEEIPLIAQLATRYVTPQDFSFMQAVVLRVERLEAKLAQAEARTVAYYKQVMNKLDLRP
jgi:hypothetical protein